MQPIDQIDTIAKKMFISDLENIFEAMEDIYRNSWHFLLHFLSLVDE